MYKIFDDNVFVAYSSKIYLYSLSAQSGEPLSEILDFALIGSIIEDLKYDIYPTANEIAESLLIISDFEITAITDEQIDLNIFLKPHYENRLLFINKEGFEFVRKYKITIDIEYIGNQDKQYDPKKITCKKLV